MSMSIIFLALSLGFLGSFHCIGMCGPIALALPVHHFGAMKKHAGIWLYQLGRLFTYAMLGLLFGLLGQAFFPAGFQQGLSIALGVLMILALVLSRTNPHIGIPAYQKFIGRLKMRLSALFQRRGLRFLFGTGVLNGLLPCGLVYIGIAGAAASGNYLRGTLFMLGFGLGTVPAMYAVAILGQFLSSQVRSQVRKAMPVMITAMALLLIVRGLNLGIPYLSPALETKHQALNCCTQQADCKPTKTTLTCCPKKH
jgi:uncharacterized protein